MKKFEVFNSGKKIGTVKFYKETMINILKDSISSIIDIIPNHAIVLDKSKLIIKKNYILKSFDDLTDLEIKEKVRDNYNRIEQLEKQGTDPNVLLKYYEGLASYIEDNTKKACKRI